MVFELVVRTCDIAVPALVCFQCYKADLKIRTHTTHVIGKFLSNYNYRVLGALLIGYRQEREYTSAKCPKHLKRITVGVVQFLFAFEITWKPMSNQLPASPGVLLPVNRQVYSRAALIGMPNICFICWKKPADFPPSPPVGALWKGVSQPPVHIRHSRGEQWAQGVMYCRNVVLQCSHSIKRECEECAFSHTGYYCTCV